MSGNRSLRFGKKNLIVICAAILLIAALSLLFVILQKIEDKNNIIDVDPGPEPEIIPSPGEADTANVIEYNGSRYKLRDDLDTLLLIGIDRFEEYIEQQTDDMSSQQCDFVFLLIFDNTNETVKAIQLNRETMVRVVPVDPGEEGYEPLIQQLALAQTYGSTSEARCQTTRNAVSTILLDTPIKHYLAFSMDTVAAVNDYYGGVTLTLSEDFTYINPAMQKGVTYTLLGDEALMYVRARMLVGDGSNIARMERHREYLQLLLERTKDPENKDKDVTTLFSKIAGYLHSDCTVDELFSYKDKFDRYSQGDILVTEGEAIKGKRYMEFYPDEEKLEKLVVDVFYQKLPNEG